MNKLLRNLLQIISAFLFPTVLGLGWKTTTYEDYFEDTDDVHYPMMGETRQPIIENPSTLKHTSDSNNEEKPIGYVIDAVRNMDYVNKDMTEEDSGLNAYMKDPAIKQMNQVSSVREQVEGLKTDIRNMKVDMKIMKGEVEMLMEDLNEMKRTDKKMMRVIAKMNGDVKGMREKMTKRMKEMQEEMVDIQKHGGTLNTVWNEGETKLVAQEETGTWNYQSFRSVDRR